MRNEKMFGSVIAAVLSLATTAIVVTPSQSSAQNRAPIDALVDFGTNRDAFIRRGALELERALDESRKTPGGAALFEKYPSLRQHLLEKLRPDIEREADILIATVKPSLRKTILRTMSVEQIGTVAHLINGKIGKVLSEALIDRSAGHKPSSFTDKISAQDLMILNKNGNLPAFEKFISAMDESAGAFSSSKMNNLSAGGDRISDKIGSIIADYVKAHDRR